MRQIGLFITTVLLSALLGQASLANGTVHYLFDESQVPVGSTFIYTKSNLDGSNAGTIAVHYLSPTIIESFKYHEGHGQATKVRATIDPGNLNVHQFEASRLAEGREQPAAQLLAEGGGRFRITLGGDTATVTLEDVPWHSYDFDFASLGFAYRFVDSPQEGFGFHVFDLVPMDGQVVFADLGEVSLTSPESDDHAGRPAMKYRINGPGLDHRGGLIWFDAEEGYLLGYEIEKPDEDSYRSGKLRLEEIVEMDAGAWQAYQRSSLDWRGTMPVQ